MTLGDDRALRHDGRDDDTGTPLDSLQAGVQIAAGVGPGFRAWGAGSGVTSGLARTSRDRLGMSESQG